MKHLIIYTFLFLGTVHFAYSQCPPSQTKGIHVVQPKDNLYRIAQAYNISMGEICKWNNIKIDDILPICKPLKVHTPFVTPIIKTVTVQAQDTPDEFFQKSDGSTIIQSNHTNTPHHNYAVQNGKKHTVQYGETVASIAERYGFTEAKFRHLNALNPVQKVTPGSILLTTECSCAVLNKDIHQYNESTTRTPTTSSRRSVPHSTNTNTHTSTNPTNYQQPQMVSPFKNLSSRNSADLVPKSGIIPTKTVYMKRIESSMVDEINLVRKKPTAYIKHIEQYVNNKRRAGHQISEQIVNELINDLNTSPKLSPLKTSECMYNAAKTHGTDIQRTQKIDHNGSDFSKPWDRVKRFCTNFQDGNENLVGGTTSIRESVIILLLDNAVPSRKHRKNILNPHWTHIACYQVGKVGQMHNTWVQKFGQETASSTSYNYHNNFSTPPSTNRPVIQQQETFYAKSGYTNSYPPNNQQVSYMQYEENRMMHEINLLRANPAQYVQHIENYRRDKKNAGYTLPDHSIDELIRELKSMRPLSQLKASQCVYNAAIKHGKDIQQMGKTSHLGSDGTRPWDRVKRSCNNFKDGNENLVGGTTSIREAIIILLIDNGVTTRTHRRTLLNPNWSHIACYKVGRVGQLSDCWVQKFGQL